MRKLLSRLEVNNNTISGSEEALVGEVYKSMHNLDELLQAHETLCAYSDVLSSGEHVSHQVYKLMRATGAMDLVNYFNSSVMKSFEDGSGSEDSKDASGKVDNAKKGIFKKIIEAISKFFSRIGEYFSQKIATARRNIKFILECMNYVRKAAFGNSEIRNFATSMSVTDMSVFRRFDFLTKSHAMISNLDKAVKNIKTMTPDTINKFKSDVDELDSGWAEINSLGGDDEILLQHLDIHNKQDLLKAFKDVENANKQLTQSSEMCASIGGSYKKTAISLMQYAEFGKDLSTEDRANTINLFAAYAKSTLNFKMEIDKAYEHAISNFVSSAKKLADKYRGSEK